MAPIMAPSKTKHKLELKSHVRTLFSHSMRFRAYSELCLEWSLMLRTLVFLGAGHFIFFGLDTLWHRQKTVHQFGPFGFLFRQAMIKTKPRKLEKTVLILWAIAWGPFREKTIAVTFGDFARSMLQLVCCPKVYFLIWYVRAVFGSRIAF